MMSQSSPNEPTFSILSPGSDSSQKEQVFRLRHDIYIQEMQLPLPHAGQMLSDDLDDHSTLFLMWMDNKLVGTARTTDCRLGDMELLRQSDEWNNDIRKIIQANDYSVVEITRLMIRREFRDGDLTARLLRTKRMFDWPSGPSMPREADFIRVLELTSITRGPVACASWNRRSTTVS